MELPNGEHAELGTKLEDYVLNPRHRDGQHKARVFERVLGIRLTNAVVLRDAILTAAMTSDTVEFRGDNGYGKVYLLRFRMETNVGSAQIITGWILRNDEEFPRLTTCYVL